MGALPDALQSELYRRVHDLEGLMVSFRQTLTIKC